MPAPLHTVLCVDDNPHDLHRITDIIKQEQPLLHIEEAVNGSEAIEYLEDAKKRGILPGLILLDLNMPLLDGRKTLTAIKKDNELTAIPVVVFTTSSNHLDRLYCKHYGVEMITKPVDHEPLTAAVQSVLHKSFA